MYPHVCTIPKEIARVAKKVTGKVSEYKRNPASINAAAACALQQAQKQQCDYLVYPGNSFMCFVYRVEYVGHDSNWLSSSNWATVHGMGKDSPMRFLIVKQDGRILESYAHPI